MRAACAWLLAIGACGFDHGSVQPAPADDASVDDANPDGMLDAIPDGRPDAGIQMVVVPLAASNDDALQDPPVSNQTLVAFSWISLYTANHWGAMRFAVPQVMRGATIVEAYLEFYVDTSANEDDPNVTFTSEASANPAALAATANNISQRPRGTASVTWQASNIGTGVRRSPLLTGIVQERVNAAGWNPGQPILFILDTQGPSFEVRQYNHAPAGMFAPTLTVRFMNP